MSITGLRRLYKSAIKKKAYEFIDNKITPAFWNIQEVEDSFTKYIYNWKSVNPYDTPNYYSMKTSEQAHFEMIWMDEILTEKRSLK